MTIQPSVTRCHSRVKGQRPLSTDRGRSFAGPGSRQNIINQISYLIYQILLIFLQLAFATCQGALTERGGIDEGYE